MANPAREQRLRAAEQAKDPAADLSGCDLSKILFPSRFGSPARILAALISVAPILREVTFAAAICVKRIALRRESPPAIFATRTWRGGVSLPRSQGSAGEKLTTTLYIFYLTIDRYFTTIYSFDSWATGVRGACGHDRCPPERAGWNPSRERSFSTWWTQTLAPAEGVPLRAGC